VTLVELAFLHLPHPSLEHCYPLFKRTLQRAFVFQVRPLGRSIYFVFLLIVRCSNYHLFCPAIVVLMADRIFFFAQYLVSPCPATLPSYYTLTESSFKTRGITNMEKSITVDCPVLFSCKREANYLKLVNSVNRILGTKPWKNLSRHFNVIWGEGGF